MKKVNKAVILVSLVFASLAFEGGKFQVLGQATPGPTLVVLNKSDDSLAIIDPGEMKILGKVQTGRDPHEVAHSADGRTAYVTNYAGHTSGNSLSVIYLYSKKEIRRVNLAPLLRPHGIQEIGGKIYFTSEANRALARYDPVSDKVDWIMGTGQNSSHMIVGTPDQKRFFATNIGSDTVTGFEFRDVPPAGSTIMNIPVGKQPEAIDMLPDGREVWVGLNVDGPIAVVDTAAGKVVDRIPLGGRPYRIKFMPGAQTAAATVLETRELVFRDVTTRKVTRRMKLESEPLGIVFSRNGKTAFVSALKTDVVLKIDLEALQIVGRVVSGGTPDGIALAGM